MIMSLDGYKPRKIVDEPISGFTWSPNGNHIVIVSANDCEDLYIINIDGSGIRQLTDRPGSEISPAWSPDGKWIAFMGTDTCGGGAISWEIFLIQPDGSGLIQLTNNPHRHPVSPSWSPLPALSSGKNFTITESGDFLNLRKIPSMNGEVLDQLNEGEEILVLEGPVEEDEYLWWKVRVIGSSLLGWVAENPGWFDGEW